LAPTSESPAKTGHDTDLYHAATTVNIERNAGDAPKIIRPFAPLIDDFVHRLRH